MNPQAIRPRPPRVIIRAARAAASCKAHMIRTLRCLRSYARRRVLLFMGKTPKFARESGIAPACYVPIIHAVQLITRPLLHIARSRVIRSDDHQGVVVIGQRLGQVNARRSCVGSLGSLHDRISVVGGDSRILACQYLLLLF